MHKEPTVILSVARTLDHPLWASGTRIISRLLAALEECDLKKVLLLFTMVVGKPQPQPQPPKG
jgi:hypothetical protein